jgi:hypothetical protein
MGCHPEFDALSRASRLVSESFAFLPPPLGAVCSQVFIAVTAGRRLTGKPGTLMLFLRYRVIPATNHPDREWLGEATVSCWINRPALAGADAVARRAIRREKWQILEREHSAVVTEANYGADDEGRRRYRQALAEGEAYVYFFSPRDPVYWVAAAVAQSTGQGTAEAHYFLCWAALGAQGEDVNKPDFWGGERARAALDAAVEAIREAGWTVTSVLGKRPCGRKDVPPELAPYYDEVEETGACLVFLQEGGEEEAPNEVPKR